jgi:hypothetical protein
MKLPPGCFTRLGGHIPWEKFKKGVWYNYDAGPYLPEVVPGQTKEQ